MIEEAENLFYCFLVVRDNLLDMLCFCTILPPLKKKFESEMYISFERSVFKKSNDLSHIVNIRRMSDVILDAASTSWFL